MTICETAVTMILIKNNINKRLIAVKFCQVRLIKIPHQFVNISLLFLTQFKN